MHKLLKAYGLQLIRGDSQTAVRVTVAPQGTLHTLDVECRETELLEHDDEGALFAEPLTLERVFSGGGVIACKLLYKHFDQELTVRLTVVAEGKEKGLGEVVEDNISTIGRLLCSFNEGQSTVCSGLEKHSTFDPFPTSALCE